MIRSDFNRLYNTLPDKLAEASNPLEPGGDEDFLRSIKGNPSAWNDLVYLYCSFNDNVNSQCELDGNANKSFPCSIGPLKKLSTQKALQSHMQTKHESFNPVIQYIGDTSTCPACGTDFRSMRK